METPSLVASLERNAAASPHACAIQQGEQQISYEQLWRNVQCVAGHLQQQGLNDGDRVALLLENSTDFVAVLYGTLLAGGVAVPLNAAATARELAAWLAHSEPRWVVTTSNRLGSNELVIPNEIQLILCGPAEEGQDAQTGLATTRLTDVLGSAFDLEAPPNLQPSSPACIMYTSGTTGRPKGVLLSHRNLASNNAAIIDYLELGAGDSVLSVLPFYYPYGASLLHTHLLCGGRIVLESNFVFPHLVIETLVKERVTGFAGVPSTYALLLSRVDLSKYDLSRLRYMTQAGAPMPSTLTQRLRAALPETKLFTMYGQTEATARLTYLPPEKLDDKIGSVGVPISGVELEIRREDGSRTVAGETGEVWARGPNVMQGYWRDPAATKLALREGWLKTGDAGYLDVDGYLFLSGRRSDMIKTGAHRVHPQDVEEVLQELDEIMEAAVVGIKDETLGQTVGAFVVLMPGSQLSELQIKHHCRSRLASYKVPKTVRFVNCLPRTASGKVRRIELMGNTNT